MIAIATAASAAAIVIINSVKNNPSKLSGNKNLLNATKSQKRKVFIENQLFMIS